MIADKRSFTFSLLLAVAVIAIDQVSKWVLLVALTARLRPEIEVTSFFNLALVWNHGISFGIFSAHNQPLLLTIMSLVIVAILLIWLAKNSSKPTAYALGLVIGGALGNVVDRVRYQAVIDFFDAHIGPYHWPAFNIADSAIFIGVVVLCAGSMLSGRHVHKESIL